MKDIESPEIYLEWGFVSLIDSALQRRVWMYGNQTTQMPSSFSLFPHKYNVLIGPPATGKGRVIRPVANLLKHGTLRTADKRGEMRPLIHLSPDKVSAERLIDCMMESTEAMEWEVEVQGKMQKRTMAHASCTFPIEELEVLFSRNSDDMVSILNQCFDAGDLSYETRHQGKVYVRNVCVNMLAGTTPEAVKNLLAEKVIATGFTSRVNLIFADRPRFYRDFPGISPAQVIAEGEILQHLKLLTTKVVGELTMSQEARDFFKSIYETGDMYEKRVNKDPRLDHYYGRKKVHWLKLAMSMHFFDQIESREISVETMGRAYNLLGKTELRMHEAFKNAGRNPIYEGAQTILRLVESGEDGEMRWKRLHFRTCSELRKEELNECLEYLLATDQIKNINAQTSIIENGIFKVNGHKAPLEEKKDIA